MNEVRSRVYSYMLALNWEPACDSEKLMSTLENIEESTHTNQFSVVVLAEYIYIYMNNNNKI